MRKVRKAILEQPAHWERAGNEKKSKQKLFVLFGVRRSTFGGQQRLTAASP